MVKLKLALALFVLSVPTVFASQIPLSPSNVIGFFGVYGPEFLPMGILDHQTGTINEPAQDGSFWLNWDNGPENAYIVIDLGAAFQIGSFDLFNTHNAWHNDRGTRAFSIEASNSVAPGTGPGNDLTGDVVTLLSGNLLSANFSSDPILAQTFLTTAPGSYRYIRFSPHSVGSSVAPCCGSNVYGLNELRVFTPSTPFEDEITDLAIHNPEPATMAFLGGGLVVFVLLRKRHSR